MTNLQDWVIEGIPLIAGDSDAFIKGTWLDQGLTAGKRLFPFLSNQRKRETFLTLVILPPRRLNRDH